MVRLPPHQSGAATPPEMYYQQDADSDHYTCIISDADGCIAYRLWAPAWYFSEERQQKLAIMAQRDFGVQRVEPWGTVERLRVMR